MIQWYKRAELQTQLTELEADWLFNEDSLTKRLMVISDQQFSISVLREEWQFLRPDEYNKLSVSPENKGWVREVFLQGYGAPWVYARSVAMQTDLKNDQYNLMNIGNKSLGSILFIDKTFSRTPLEATCYPIEFLPTTHQLPNLWGRWSSFVNEDINVIVQEVFLPAFWKKLQERQ